MFLWKLKIQQKYFIQIFKLIAKIFLMLPVIICSFTIIAIIFNLINKPINWYQIVVFIPLSIIIISILLNLFFIYDTMRYEFRYDGLYLICGKYINKISYNEILEWKKKNLKFCSLGSIRIPGFSFRIMLFSFLSYYNYLRNIWWKKCFTYLYKAPNIWKNS